MKTSGIRFRVKEGDVESSVECPASWDEITVAQYLRLKTASTLVEVFGALTGRHHYDGISEDILERNVFPYLTYIADKPDFENLPIPPDYLGMPKNLGHGTFGQKLRAQKIIHKAFKGGKADKVDVTEFMVELLAVYCCDDKPNFNILNIPFVQAYPLFNHYCNEILRLVKRDKQYLDRKPDADLTLAGINSLDKFGEMKIIDSLAGGDSLKYNEVLALEYDVVFKKLWYNVELEEFRKRLYRVKTKRAQANAKATT